MSDDELEHAVATSTLTAPTSSAGVVASPVSGSLLVSSSDDADTIMKIVTRTVVGVPPVPDVGPTSTSSNPVVNIKTKSTILKLYKMDVLRLYDITDFAERLKMITKAWRSVVVLLESTTTEECDNVMYLALRHTLHTMLMGKWSTISAQDRDYIRKQIELCIPLVEKCSSNSLYRCQYVLTQLDDPWGHPILQQLMGNNDDDETDEDSPGIVQSQSGVPFKRFADGTDESHPLASAICEEITFLAREKACMIALRLQKLCECRIYDQACSLAGRMIRALRTCSPKDSLRKNTSVSQEGYIFDIYLVLLYYLGQTEEFLAEIRALDLNNALFLCSRNPPHPHQLVTRLKPYYNQVIEKALQVFMTQFLSSKLSAGQDVYLRELCVHWVIRNQSHEDYQTRLRLLVTLCNGYQNVYILLDALTQLFPDRNDHKWDKLEMLCRGMTRELNELEQMKTDHSIGARRILASEQQIAPRFLTLADVFEDFPKLARELTLTSFSLQPTDIVFQKIQTFAINSANVLNGLSNIQSSQAAALLLECPIHDELAAGDTATPSSLCSRSGVRVQSAIVRTEIDRMEYVQRVGALHSVTGNQFSDIYSYDATSAPNLILDAIKTLSFEYRQDLLTLISAPRIKNLSWLMEWPELHQNCLDLFRTSAKIARIEHTVATANDHLDFLYPDFERYRNMKPHQYPGIENGYEIYRNADNGDDDAAATEQSNCGIHDEDISSASEAERKLSDLKAKEKKTQLAERRKRHYANRAKIDPTTTKVPKVKMAEETRRKTRPHSRQIDPTLRRPRGRPILYREDGLPASATRLKKLQSFGAERELSELNAKEKKAQLSERRKRHYANRAKIDPTTTKVTKVKMAEETRRKTRSHSRQIDTTLRRPRGRPILYREDRMPASATRLKKLQSFGAERELSELNAKEKKAQLAERRKRHYANRAKIDPVSGSLLVSSSDDADTIIVTRTVVGVPPVPDVGPTSTSSNPVVNIKTKSTILKLYKMDVLRLYDITDFAERLKMITKAWRSVVVLLESTTTEECDNVMYLALRHTLHTMLMGKWSTISAQDRDYIRKQIELCIPLVEKCSSNSLYRCQYVLTQLDDPWGHPILQQLMGNNDDDETDEDSPGIVQSQSGVPFKRFADGTDESHPLASAICEEVTFLAREKACMIALRLQKLCECRIYDQACSLAGRMIRALRTCSPKDSLRKNTSVSQEGYIFDIYLVLLYYLGQTEEFLAEIRALDLNNALFLCSRNPPHPHQLVTRLKPYYNQVIEKALQVFMTQFLSSKLSAGQDVYLRELCVHWVIRNQSHEDYQTRLRLLVTLCNGYQNVYILLDALTQLFPDRNDHKWDKLEMLCRGMTRELNELEQMKTDHSIGARRILASEQQIAPRFLTLADVFEDFPELARELTLTSFSLQPTDIVFQKIQTFAINSANVLNGLSNIQSSQAAALLLECPIHDKLAAGDTATPSSVCSGCGVRVQSAIVRTEIDRMEYVQRVGALHSVTVNRFSDIYSYDATSAPNLILDAIKTLSFEYRQDLLTLISAPRIKNLSWLMEWPELHQNCLDLFRTSVKIARIEHTVATANDHLDFLYPDFERYRNMKPHQYPGIENGYEMFYRDADNGEDDAAATEQSNCGIHDEDTSSESEAERELSDLNAKEKKAQLAERRKRHYANRAKIDPTTTKVPKVKMAEETSRKTRPHSRQIDPKLRRPRARPILYREDGLPASATRLKKLNFLQNGYEIYRNADNGDDDAAATEQSNCGIHDEDTSSASEAERKLSDLKAKEKKAQLAERRKRHYANRAKIDPTTTKVPKVKMAEETRRKTRPHSRQIDPTLRRPLGRPILYREDGLPASATRLKKLQSFGAERELSELNAKEKKAQLSERRKRHYANRAKIDPTTTKVTKVKMAEETRRKTRPHSRQIDPTLRRPRGRPILYREDGLPASATRLKKLNFLQNGYEIYRNADNGDDDAAATEQSNCGIHDEDTSSASEAERKLSDLKAKEKKAQLAERRKRHYANRAKIDPTTTKVPKVKMAEETRRKTRPHSRQIDPTLRRPRGRPILYRKDGLPASATSLKKLQSFGAERELSELNAKEKKAQLSERRKRHYANRAKIDPTTTKVTKVKMAEETRRKTRPHSRQIDPTLRRPRGRPILYREDGLPASATRLKKLQSFGAERELSELNAKEKKAQLAERRKRHYANRAKIDPVSGSLLVSSSDDADTIMKIVTRTVVGVPPVPDVGPTSTSSNPVVNIKTKSTILKLYKMDVLRLYDITDFEERLKIITKAWRSVVVLLESTTTEECDNVMYLALRHTLHTMLMGKWSTISAQDRDYIRKQIELCIPLVEKCSSNSLYRCQYVLTQLDDPWGHPILQQLMGNNDDDETDEDSPGIVQSQSGVPFKRFADGTDESHPLASAICEEITFLAREKACMIALRLQKLCECRIYDQACSLAGRMIRALRTCSPKDSLRKNTSVSQEGYIFDIYLVLLYYLGRTEEFMAEIRALDLNNALFLCSRNPPHPHQLVTRLKPYYNQVIEKALQVFMTQFLSSKLSAGQDVYLRGLCVHWVIRNQSHANYQTRLRLLVTLCNGYQNVYILLDALTQLFPDRNDHKWDKLEMLCRGMTRELNELEQMKTDHSIGAQRILASEQQIAPRFLTLADVFEDFPELARELTLTSFSLQPTDIVFQKIQTFAINSANVLNGLSNIQSSQAAALLLECPIHDELIAGDTATPSSLCSGCGVRVQSAIVRTEIDRMEYVQRVGALHSVTGNRFSDIYSYDATSAPNLILDAIKTLSFEYRKDLLTLISAPRIKNLSWLMEWPELHQNCLDLFRTSAKIARIEHTVATANDHLDFLYPDFERNRNMKPHQYPGIENGYEMFYRDADNGDDDAAATEQSNCGIHDEDTSSESKAERELSDLNAKEKKAQLAERRKRHYANRAKIDPTTTKVPKVKMAEETRRKTRPHSRQIDPKLRRPRGRPILYREDGLPASATRLKKLKFLQNGYEIYRNADNGDDDAAATEQSNCGIHDEDTSSASEAKCELSDLNAKEKKAQLAERRKRHYANRAKIDPTTTKVPKVKMAEETRRKTRLHSRQIDPTLRRPRGRPILYREDGLPASATRLKKLQSFGAERELSELNAKEKKAQLAERRKRHYANRAKIDPTTTKVPKVKMAEETSFAGTRQG